MCGKKRKKKKQVCVSAFTINNMYDVSFYHNYKYIHNLLLHVVFFVVLSFCNVCYQACNSSQIILILCL